MRRFFSVCALAFVAVSAELWGDFSATAQPSSQDPLAHKTQEHRIDIIQMQQRRLDLIQRPQDRVTPEFLHETLPEPPAHASEERRLLSIAWRLFTRGDYRRARDLFTTLTSDPEVKWEATHGLAMCFVKLKDKRAIPLLELLLEREATSKELRAQLAIELHHLGRFAEAERHFDALLKERH